MIQKVLYSKLFYGLTYCVNCLQVNVIHTPPAMFRQHWFNLWLMAPSHYLRQCWPNSICHMEPLGHNELSMNKPLANNSHKCQRYHPDVIKTLNFLWTSKNFSETDIFVESHVTVSWKIFQGSHEVHFPHSVPVCKHMACYLCKSITACLVTAHHTVWCLYNIFFSLKVS